MNLTDELHKMLDKCNVEYQFDEYTKVFELHFDGMNGEGCAYITEVHDGINIIAGGLTPAQIIAAILETGTCRRVPDRDSCGGDAMTATDELKPCPFCGGKAEFRSGSSTTPYIRCKECGGRTKSSHNKANLIAAWNRRAHDRN